MKNLSFESLVPIAVLLVLLPSVDLVGSQRNGDGLTREGKRKSEGVIVYGDGLHQAPNNQTAQEIMGMTSSKIVPGNWNSLSPTLSDVNVFPVPASASSPPSPSQASLRLHSHAPGQYHPHPHHHREMFQSSSPSSLPGGKVYYKLPLSSSSPSSSSSSSFLPSSSQSPEHYAGPTSPLTFSMTTSSAGLAGAVSNQVVSHAMEIPLPLASSSRVTGPYFESNRSTIHISAKAGQNMVLDCAVILLQGRTVSWLRRGKDSLQLLTVGNTTYYSDSRLGLRFRYPNNWRLGIESVNKMDEGEYQCQLSTHPPKVLIYRLKVIAPTVLILDENGHTVTERHYKVDSSLHLTCRASHVDKLVEKVVWLKGDRALPGGDSRIKVKVGKNEEDGEASLYLSVLSVRKGDSGNYSCRAGASTVTTVTVHVLNGELPAAVQHESCAGKGRAAIWIQLAAVLIWLGLDLLMSTSDTSRVGLIPGSL